MKPVDHPGPPRNLKIVLDSPGTEGGGEGWGAGVRSFGFVDARSATFMESVDGPAGRRFLRFQLAGDLEGQREAAVVRWAKGEAEVIFEWHYNRTSWVWSSELGVLEF